MTYISKFSRFTRNTGQFYFLRSLLRCWVTSVLPNAFRNSYPHISIIALICQPFTSKWCIKRKMFFPLFSSKLSKSHICWHWDEINPTNKETMRAKSRRKKNRKCPVDWFSNLIESSEGFSWPNNSYVPSPVWEDPLEKEMATHSSVLAWEIPWTEETGRLQSMGSQRVGHDLATKQQQQQIYNIKWTILTIFKVQQGVSIITLSNNKCPDYTH